MKYSVLDLACLREGETYRQTYENQLALAKAVEGFGYARFWIAEHHNTRRLGSSATQILIQRVLANTEHMRVGSGGVMLPNHSPYLVAEQYATLETLYPGRVDLGLGRAPGTDLKTAQAIRRTENIYPDFERDVAELVSYFEGTANVHAYPAEGLRIPLYVLGSSTESAYFAARMGLPYSFAAHFAPGDMEAAIEIYRSLFNPSEWLDAPYVILGINAIVADSDKQAERLSTTHLQSVLGILNDSPKGLLPPKESEEAVWADYEIPEDVPHFGPVAFDRETFIGQEKEIVKRMSAVSLVGSPDSFASQLAELRERVQFEEVVVNSFIYDLGDQIRSYELVAKAIDEHF